MRLEFGETREHKEHRGYVHKTRTATTQHTNNNVLDLQLWLDRDMYPPLCIWWMGMGEEEYP